MKRLAGLLVLALAAICQAAPSDFTFYHFSDVHSPVPGSREVIAGAQRSAGRAPAFALVTGDLCEFGAGEGAFENLLGYFAGWSVPVHLVLGNHDSTWWISKPRLRALPDGYPYRFTCGGCEFVVLDSTGRGDPRPGFGVEELRWLADQLRTIAPETPLFVACHHPLAGSEWATPWDYERLLELLQGHNVAAILVGHGHTARRHRFGDCDGIEGGSTFDGGARPPSGGAAGYMIYDVRAGRLTVRYQRHQAAEPVAPLLDKTLAPRPILPPAALAEPVRRGSQLAVNLRWPGPADAAGTLALDADQPVPLARDGDRWQANLDLTGAAAGRHVLRARLTAGDRVVLASREVLLPGGPRLCWTTSLPAAVKARPTVTAERVYVPAQDGVLYALSRADGAIGWRVKTGGDLLGAAAVAPGLVIFGSTDGQVTAVDDGGRVVWQQAMAAPVSAPVTVAGDRVVVAAIDGTVAALDLRTGRPLWRVAGASHTIESQPVVADQRVFVGAWDRELHALSLADGHALWSAVSASANRKAAARYYSPADAAPTVLGERVYVADRGYRLSSFEVAGGAARGTLDNVAATALSADGRSLLLRRVGKGGGAAEQVSPDLAPQWSTACGLGYLPVAPAAAGVRVAVTTDRGLLSVLDAGNGKLLWQWRLSAGLYQPGGAVVAGDTVIAAGQDGRVQCLQP